MKPHAESRIWSLMLSASSILRPFDSRVVKSYSHYLLLSSYFERVRLTQLTISLYNIKDKIR